MTPPPVPEIDAATAATSGYVLVDVRAPVEYADGHAPGAVSLPLLDDAERAAVGTLYAEGGPAEARVLAMRLTSPKLGRYLGYLRRLARTGPLAIMCWRGGDRSGNVVRLLELIGVDAVRVTGGYKAYRRWVLDGLEAWSPGRPVVTLYGYTGSGKTAILRHMAALVGEGAVPGGGEPPRPAIVDLEGLALHRGSLLGGLNQPGSRSQKQFDALLWDELRRVEGDYLVLEGEGAKIGHIFLPARVAEAIRGGVAVQVAVGADLRTERILEEYDPRGWSAAERETFLGQLTRIGSRMEAEAVARVREAFLAGHYAEAVRDLLVGYYDPLYYRSCVSGKPFAYTVESRGDTRADAERLLADLPRVLDEIERSNPSG